MFQSALVSCLFSLHILLSCWLVSSDMTELRAYALYLLRDKLGALVADQGGIQTVRLVDPWTAWSCGGLDSMNLLEQWWTTNRCTPLKSAATFSNRELSGVDVNILFPVIGCCLLTDGARFDKNAWPSDCCRDPKMAPLYVLVCDVHFLIVEFAREKITYPLIKKHFVTERRPHTC